MSGQELTITKKLRDICRQKPDADAFVSYNEVIGRQAISFAELYTLSRRFAYVLKEHGVKPGDYVAITLPVSLETAVATFGIMLAGAVAVSLEITFKSGEGLMQGLSKIKPKLVIVKDEPDDNIMNFFKSSLASSPEVTATTCTVGIALPRLPDLTTAYLVKRGGTLDFLDGLRKAGSGKEYEYDKVHGKMSCIMHFTTGTVTDYLKMTEMTHEAAVRYCDSYSALFDKSRDKYLYINGWFWVSGMPQDIFNGVTRCIPDCWVASKDFSKLLYDFIRSEGIRFADVQPIYMDRIMELWKADQKDGKPLLDLLTILGMPITRRSLIRFKRITHAFNLIYGSHECGANHFNIVRADQVDTYTDFDCGFPMPNVESKIVDENWKPVPIGEKGRLLLKTPGMFRGYPSEPERSSRCFNEDGWFITNDRALYHKESKHLMVGGRIDSIILHGEYMLYPMWMEEMVSSQPSISQVISVPVADDVLFHAIGLCVILKPGCQLTKDDVRVQLGRYLFPEKIYIFEVKHLLQFDHFPLDKDGNVDRSRLFDIVHEKTSK